MNHLRRELAPLSDTAWKTIDDEAARALTKFLAARRLLPFGAPRGWEFSGERLVRTEPVVDAGDGVKLRVVRGLVELSTPFTVPTARTDEIDRGHTGVELDMVVEAAKRAANDEDALILVGYPAAGIQGIGDASPHKALALPPEFDDYPTAVARAVEVLRQAGVEGPYGVALGPRGFTGVVESTEHGGYPVFEHLRMILGGPVVWAPSVAGALVISLRGGDYEIDCGQALSIGFAGADRDAVHLYLEESLALHIAEPAAAICLIHG